jgi:hypothetical protein
MARYPDILNNPDGDPRIYQQQYEGWYREQEEYEKPEKYQQSEEVDNSSFDR